jgi:hypothetical protein
MQSTSQNEQAARNHALRIRVVVNDAENSPFRKSKYDFSMPAGFASFAGEIFIYFLMLTVPIFPLGVGNASTAAAMSSTGTSPNRWPLCCG